MKTKLTAVTYLGFTAMDRRFSNAMLPWLLREIRATGVRDKLSIAIEDGCLKAYNGNFEPVIVHRLVDIIRASQVPGRPEELFYILLNEKEGLLNCFLFKAATVHEGMQYHFLFNHAILALFQICAYTWFGEQAIFKGSQLKRALLEFDWTSMRRKDKKNYLIIISYMKKEFRIKTAFNNDLCLVTMTSLLKASYQACALLRTMDI